MKNYRHYVAGIFVLAFALRASYALLAPHGGLPPDATTYDAVAWNLASEGRIEGVDGELTAHRPPVYLIFLASIYKLTNHNLTAARLVQGGVGALLVVLLVTLVRRITKEPVAFWMTGLMAAVYPFFIYYDSDLIADALMTFCLVLSVWLWMVWRENPRSLWLTAVCGLSFAVLALIKTIFIPLFIALLGSDVLLTLDRGDRAKRWGRLCLMAAVFSGPICWWGLRNKAVFGKFLLDTHGGITSVETIMFYAQCKQGVFPEFFENHPLKKAAAGMDEAERDAFYLKQTRDFIRANPGRYLRQALGNIKNFWRFYPRQDINFKEGLAKITVISLLTEPFLILTGFLGLALTRRKWRTLYPIYLAILLLSGVHALSTGQMRYRLPVMPFMITFSAVFLASLKKKTPA